MHIRIDKGKRVDDITDDTDNDVITDEPSDDRPKLNAARFYSIGSYRGFYDIKCVDEKKQIWKGRPIIEPSMQKSPIAAKLVSSWVFFTREYDDRNDWDRLYHEHWFEDESILGQKFLLVPKEKILFAYEPPPTGILIIEPGVYGGN